MGFCIGLEVKGLNPLLMCSCVRESMCVCRPVYLSICVPDCGGAHTVAVSQPVC